MNDSELKPAVAAETEDLKQQCAWMQRQMTTLLLGLVIVSSTLTIFLWRQVRYARRDLESIKVPAAQVVQEYNQSRANMDAFVSKLSEYGRTHPDFVPILNKYRIPISTGAPPAAVTTPKPPASPPAPAAKP